jgi:hypothetical protein
MDKNLSLLMAKPVAMMTGQEMFSIFQLSSQNQQSVISPTLITGARALAEYLGCCETTVYLLKKEGVLENAIVSHIGRKIVFDGEKARALAEEYRKAKESKG